MKKLFIFMFIIALLGVNSGSAIDSPLETLSRIFPSDAVVFVATPSLKNLIPTIQEHPLLKKFQSSSESLQEEEDDVNYEGEVSSIATAFEQSRLYLKLENKFKEASKIFGFDISLQIISEVAGEESALAIYDIGELRMVFICKVSRFQMMKSKFAVPGEKFEERRSGNLIYYVASDGTGALVAFAITDNWFLFSNDLSLMERTIDLMEGKGKENLAESWFKGILEPSILSADLVIALNQSTLNDDLYFRTYWIHRNAKQLKWIERTALAVKFERDIVRETRIFTIRDGAEHPFAGEVSLGLARIPADAMWLDVRANRKPDDLAECLVKWIMGYNQSDNQVFVEDIANLFKNAHPMAMARVSAPYIEKNLFYKDQRKLLAVQLGNANAFDKNLLLNKISSRYNQTVGVAGLVSATIVNKGGIEVISLPLLERHCSAFFVKDATFIASNDYSFLKEYLSASPVRDMAENDVLYSRLNAAIILTHLSDIYKRLGEYPDWTSYDSQPFFHGVVPSLFDIMRVVKSAVLHGYVKDRTFVEEVIYSF